MKHLIIALAVIALACTDESNTRRTLHSAGFTRVETTGYTPFTCGEHDAFSTGFRATNPTGQVVEGTVCCGLLKACTIRF